MSASVLQKCASLSPISFQRQAVGKSVYIFLCESPSFLVKGEGPNGLFRGGAAPDGNASSRRLRDCRQLCDSVGLTRAKRFQARPTTGESQDGARGQTDTALWPIQEFSVEIDESLGTSLCETPRGDGKNSAWRGCCGRHPSGLGDRDAPQRPLLKNTQDTLTRDSCLHRPTPCADNSAQHATARRYSFLSFLTAFPFFHSILPPFLSFLPFISAFPLLSSFLPFFLSFLPFFKCLTSARTARVRTARHDTLHARFTAVSFRNIVEVSLRPFLLLSSLTPSCTCPL